MGLWARRTVEGFPVDRYVEESVNLYKKLVPDR